VGTSIYYATPVPLLTCYRDKYGYKPGDFPNAEFLANNSLALPVGQHLSEDDIDYIVKTIKEIVA
jgi:perosamine synthetase